MLRTRILPTLGSKPIAWLKKSDVIRLLEQLEDDYGPVSADRALALIRRILNWWSARSDDFRSPLVRGMARTKPSEHRRARVLTDDEIRAVWAACDQLPVFGPYVRFLLATGARRNEVAMMKWSELDENGVWRLPKERSKTGVELARPLSRMALDILDGIPRTGCAFPFSYNGRTGMTGFSKPKRELDQRVAAVLAEENGRLPIPIPRWTIHDVRRTSASLMQREHVGVSREVIEACLGHAIKGVAGTYQRHSYGPEMKRAFEALSAEVMRILNPPSGDNVVQLAEKLAQRGDQGGQG
jgi:integrase